MLRPVHLPPRCPPATQNLFRFPSLGSILEEEQPSWFDELLADSGDGPRGIYHRRSASDPVAFLEGPTSLQCPSFNAESDVEATISLPKLEEIGEGSETCNGFEGNCVYGPNSPRQKSSLSNSEVNALLESIPRNPLQYVAVEYPTRNVPSGSDAKRDFYVADGDLDPEKASRSRSGQRSRVRKLQYIAELERTVDVYQTLGAELATGVASLFQQRVALSLENKNLRQQIAGLQQEKMIKDGHCRSLKNELDKLQAIHGSHRRSKSAASGMEMGHMETDLSGASWQMLDFESLNLSGKPLPIRHGFGL